MRDWIALKLIILARRLTICGDTSDLLRDAEQQLKCWIEYNDS